MQADRPKRCWRNATWGLYADSAKSRAPAKRAKGQQAGQRAPRAASRPLLPRRPPRIRFSSDISGFSPSPSRAASPAHLRLTSRSASHEPSPFSKKGQQAKASRPKAKQNTLRYLGLSPSTSVGNWGLPDCLVTAAASPRPRESTLSRATFPNLDLNRPRAGWPPERGGR